jgi:hypothetical protein
MSQTNVSLSIPDLERLLCDKCKERLYAVVGRQVVSQMKKDAAKA